MKHRLMHSASALAFATLSLAAMPALSETTAGKGIYLPNATSTEINEAIKNVKPFDMEKAKQESYDLLVKEVNDNYERDLKAWEADQKLNSAHYAENPGISPKPQKPVINEAQLRARAEVKANELKAMYDSNIAAAHLMAQNKHTDEVINANNASNAAWHAAAEATLAALTTKARAAGLTQSQYDSLITKAAEDIYKHRTASLDKTDGSVPAIIATPQADALFALQSAEQKKQAPKDKAALQKLVDTGAYASIEAAKQSNPYAYGIVDTYTMSTLSYIGQHPQPTPGSVAATGSDTVTKTAGTTSKESGPITISLPAEGKVKKLSNGYTVDSSGIVKDASGKSVAVLTASGQFVDVTGKPLDAAKQSEMTGLFSTASTTTDTTTTNYGIAEDVKVDQSNAYIAATDDGVIRYSGRAGVGIKTAPSGIGTPSGNSGAGGGTGTGGTVTYVDKGTEGTGTGGGTAGGSVTPPVASTPPATGGGVTPPVVSTPPVSGGGGGGGGGRGGSEHHALH